MYRLLSFSTPVADIIWWVLNSFSTYPNGALKFHFASSPPLRARVDMHPSPRLFPPSKHRPLSNLLSVYGERQDQSIAVYTSVRTTPAALCATATAHARNSSHTHQHH